LSQASLSLSLFLSLSLPLSLSLSFLAAMEWAALLGHVLPTMMILPHLRPKLMEPANHGWNFWNYEQK
jgi:hypothetical protein